MEVMDSAARTPQSTVGGWLTRTVPKAASLRIQTAYYSDGALYAIENELIKLLKRGGAFRMVLGGNQKAATEEDIKTLLTKIAPFSNAKVAVVLPGPSPISVHSKIYHVESPGNAEAWVGSANFTASGIANNIEAGIALDRACPGEVAAVDQLRDNFDRWFENDHAWLHNIRVLDLDLLPFLLGAGVLTRAAKAQPASPAVLPGANRGAGALALPSMKIPKRPPSARRSRSRATQQVGIAAQGKTHPAMPPGFVATVKTLGAQDVRGLQNLSGTWYLSLGLPKDRFFPKGVVGGLKDPRIETVVEARLVTLPRNPANSGPASTTSITLEGAAAGTKTNVNARVNLSKHLAEELRTIAAANLEALPDVGDLAVVEYLAGQPVVVRVTFIRQEDESFAQLQALIGQGKGSAGVATPPRGYGWLRANDVQSLLPSW